MFFKPFDYCLQKCCSLWMFRFFTGDFFLKMMTLSYEVWLKHLHFQWLCIVLTEILTLNWLYNLNGSFEQICIMILMFLHALFKYAMSTSASHSSTSLQHSGLGPPTLYDRITSEGKTEPTGPLWHQLQRILSLKLVCPLIRFDSSNWISLWNKHPFIRMNMHTNTYNLDTETLLSWLFAQWLLFSVKAANRSKLLQTT